jgi:hypothetical protein
VKALQSRGSTAESKASSKSKTLRAAPTVLSMWPSKIKLDEEKSKHAVLAQRNGFGPEFLLK